MPGMVTKRKPHWERRREVLQVKIQPSLLKRLRAAAGPRGVGRFVRAAIRAALGQQREETR